MSDKILKSLLFFIILTGLATSAVHAEQTPESEPQFWDRFYGDYRIQAEQSRNLPGIQLWSFRDGSPYVEFKPEVDSLEHQGTLGFKLGEWLSLPIGTNSRLEFGGAASETGTHKQQIDTPVSADGPIVPFLKDASISTVDIAGATDARASYTYTQSHRDYFVDFKFDYHAGPQLILTPSVGFIYSQWDRTHKVLLDASIANGYRLYTESVNSTSRGARVGADLEVPLGSDLSLLFGSRYTLNYDDHDLTVHEFDNNLGQLNADDKLTRLSHTTDLTLGVQKKWGNVALAVTGGFSFYSHVPRVVNPLKATDPDVHLDGQNAYSQYIQLAFSYAV